MDSCHLFNFLFGTKRATTELSKCFSSMAGSSTTTSSFAKRKQQKGAQSDSGANNKNNNINNNSSNNDSRRTDDDISPPYGSDGETSKPASPLKQLQMRLTGGLMTNKQTNKNRPRSGTYRAALVKLDDIDDEKILDGETEAALVIAGCDRADEPAGRVELVPNIAVKDDRDSDDNGSISGNNGGTPDATSPSETEQQRRPASSLPAESGQELERQQTPNRGRPAPVPRRVVLYDSSDDSTDNGASDPNHRRQSIVSSAEVYNIVNEYGEARARLRRIGSVTYGDNEDNNNNRVSVNHIDHSLDSNCSLTDNERAVLTKTTTSVVDQKVDKRSPFVKSLVQSIESNKSFDSSLAHELVDAPSRLEKTLSFSKPVTIVKPMPPKTPPKTNKAKYLNWQLALNKPTKINQLLHDDTFLMKLFDKLEPLDRCNAAQVCRKWRNVLYAKHDYWRDLVNVIDCTQLRRDHLVECIMNTLQSAKLKQQAAITCKEEIRSSSRPLGNKIVKLDGNNNSELNQYEQVSHELDQELDNFIKSKPLTPSIDPLADIDQDDVWRIQELCNRFTQRTNQRHLLPDQNATSNAIQQQPTTGCVPSKSSSSIPSQLSSTLSSVSLSSLLSPWSESSRIDCIREKLYNSFNERGFDAICLFGATDEDIEDLVSKMPAAAHKRITIARLNNCCISDKGLQLFISTFTQLKEMELSGCNEITNLIELRGLPDLRRLAITDCINIADGIAQRLAPILHQLDELILQAYHLTDAFLEYLVANANTNQLKRLELPNCKEITNQSLLSMAKHFTQLEYLSLSGSTKIRDDGIEILTEQSRQLKCLDLSWCSRITDASLECIACDLGDTLTDLILDRNIYITDIGLGHLATMSKLTLLYIRWCPRITDVGVESILARKSLKYLSLAGLHQITARSLLCITETNLVEVELTNCPAVNRDLLMFLTSKLPCCNIIF